MSHQRESSDPNLLPLDPAELDSARAWVDNEFDASTAEAFEKTLTREPSLRAAVARVSALRTLLSDLPRTNAPVRIRADLLDRVRDSYDPVASQLSSATRVSAPPDIREALRMRIREEATATSTGSTQAGSTQAGSTQAGSTQAGSTQTTSISLANGRRLSASPNETTDSTAQAPVRTHLVGGGAMRFVAAAVILLSASALLLSGGRRQPQRPTGALTMRIEFAQVRPRPAVSPSQVGADSSSGIHRSSESRSSKSRAFGGGQ